jgi:DNA mismatch endonuclease (patch repair protein)
LRKYNAVIFVNGCFWHGHECALFKIPSSNRLFWIEKIRQNKERDLKVIQSLSNLGWRVLVIHECAFRGKGRREMATILDLATQWLVNGHKNADISGL